MLWDWCARDACRSGAEAALARRHGVCRVVVGSECRGRDGHLDVTVTTRRDRCIGDHEARGTIWEAIRCASATGHRLSRSGRVLDRHLTGRRRQVVDDADVREGLRRARIRDVDRERRRARRIERAAAKAFRNFRSNHGRG